MSKRSLIAIVVLVVLVLATAVAMRGRGHAFMRHLAAGIHGHG